MIDATRNAGADPADDRLRHREAGQRCHHANPAGRGHHRQRLGAKAFRARSASLCLRPGSLKAPKRGGQGAAVLRCLREHSVGDRCSAGIREGGDQVSVGITRGGAADTVEQLEARVDRQSIVPGGTGGADRHNQVYARLAAKVDPKWGPRQPAGRALSHRSIRLTM